jgi:hypothetical protein
MEVRPRLHETLENMMAQKQDKHRCEVMGIWNFSIVRRTE